MNKKILLSILSLASVSAFSADYFVSHQGGVWSKPSTWAKNAVPNSSVSLRMAETSGNLEVDGDRVVANWSVWGKHQNIHILNGSSLTLGSYGLNQQTVSMCVSGEGFLKFAKNTMVAYGGDGGSLNLVGNTICNKITFDNSRKLLKNITISTRQPIDRIFKTTLKDNGRYHDFSLYGLKGVNTKVRFMGNTTIGDIDINNNAHLVINTARLFMSGQYGKIEVNNSTLELIRKGPQYFISSKVRLNGDSKLVLSNNPYENLVNVLFNSGNTNTVEIKDASEFRGFCFYAPNNKSVKTLKIVLPKKAPANVLKLHTMVFNPKSKMCMSDCSLTKGGNGQKVDNLYIEFVNFKNGVVKLDKGLATPADYAKIKAKGWKDFRLEKGYLTATKQ